jgi:integrase
MLHSKTIKELSSEWIEDKKKYVKRSTYALYSVLLENQILPAFGASHSLNEVEVQEFIFKKISSGLSRKSVRDMVSVVKMIKRYGIRVGVLEPSEWCLKFPMPPVKTTPVVMSLQDQKKILNYIEKNFTFKSLGIYICLLTGMRIGEICALKWKDIDLEYGIFHVRRTIERIYIIEDGQRKTELLVGTPKTASSLRDIPISHRLLRMLKPMKNIVNDDNYFLTNGQKPLEPRTYGIYYLRLLKTLGIQKMKFHGLRHSFATRCIESGCDYKTLSSILGHADIGTTLNLYVHPDITQKKKCIEKMSRAIKF